MRNAPNLIRQVSSRFSGEVVHRSLGRLTDEVRNLTVEVRATCPKLTVEVQKLTDEV